MDEGGSRVSERVQYTKLLSTSACLLHLLLLVVSASVSNIGVYSTQYIGSCFTVMVCVGEERGSGDRC